MVKKFRIKLEPFCPCACAVLSWGITLFRLYDLFGPKKS